MKPGYKTTEFWLALISGILGLLNQSGALGAPLPADAIMSVAAPVVTYIATRSVAKAVAQYVGPKKVDATKLND